MVSKPGTKHFRPLALPCNRAFIQTTRFGGRLIPVSVLQPLSSMTQEGTTSTVMLGEVGGQSASVFAEKIYSPLQRGFWNPSRMTLILRQLRHWHRSDSTPPVMR